MPADEPAETILPLLEEAVRVSRRTVEAGRVRVAVTTETEQRLLRETLRARRVEVERIPLDRMLPEGAAPPPSREEGGDTLVIPIVEERVVVQRRLVLREELRLRFITAEEHWEQPVTLRRQRAAVERLPPGASQPSQGGYRMARMITAYFVSYQAAESAAHDLATRIGGVRGEVYDARNADDLDRFALPENDRATLDEGIRRGGAVLSAEVPEGRFEEVASVLEQAGAKDLDNEEQSWRSEGWQGRTDMRGTETHGLAGTGATESSARATLTDAPATGTATPGTSGAARTEATERLGPPEDEARLPVVEERLRVGKREVEHGRVRVRSYVVETPIEE